MCSTCPSQTMDLLNEIKADVKEIVARQRESDLYCAKITSSNKVELREIKDDVVDLYKKYVALDKRLIRIEYYIILAFGGFSVMWFFDIPEKIKVLLR